MKENKQTTKANLKPKETIPLKEQEMVINYIPDEMNDMAEIYTTIPWLMKNLADKCEKYPNHYTMVKDDQYSVTVKMPFSLVQPRKPRIISEEQRAEAAARLEKARSHKDCVLKIDKINA